MILEFTWWGEKLRIVNTILKNNFGELLLLDFKTYYKATAIKWDDNGRVIK